MRLVMDIQCVRRPCQCDVVSPNLFARALHTIESTHVRSQQHHQSSPHTSSSRCNAHIKSVPLPVLLICGALVPERLRRAVDSISVSPTGVYATHTLRFRVRTTCLCCEICCVLVSLVRWMSWATVLRNMPQGERDYCCASRERQRSDGAMKFKFNQSRCCWCACNMATVLYTRSVRTFRI